MKFEKIAKIVEGVRFIRPENARILYDLIIREGLVNILELGIAHGTATCYMAAALDELGRGHITSVDLESARAQFRPSPEEQLETAGLARYVSIHRMKTGYNWFLHNKIRENTTDDACTEEYDLAIIDGPKNWTIDGLCFFLVDKLLKAKGIVIFDDYGWTYARSNRKRTETDGIVHDSLSPEELTTPHIREVFELLVMQHPNYSQFELIENSGWAMARKIASDSKTFVVRQSSGSKGSFKRLLRKLGLGTRRAQASS